jgi:hypothetical protein
MPRYLLQSSVTGCYLCPSLEDGSPVWVRSLREAGGGVSTDPEDLAQMALDHCDFDDMPSIVDLDRLGTANDYPVNG